MPSSPARISFETLPRLTADPVIFAQVPTRQAKLLVKAKGTTLAQCAATGLVDLEGTDIYNNWILSEYQDVSKQDREWTEIVFLPPSLPTLAAQSAYNFEVTDGTDTEWPRLTQTFYMLRSGYTKGMAVTAPPAQAGTGWVRTGERELNTPDPRMHFLFVVLEVHYTPTGTVLTSYELDPETRDLVTVTRQIVASSSVPSATVGMEVDQRVLGYGFALRTTRTIASNTGTGYTLRTHVDFQFPALLSYLAPSGITALDGSEFFKVNPVLSASYRKAAQGIITTDFFNVSSPPALSTLFLIKPIDISYSGFLFSLGISNVICNADTIAVSTSSDNPSWGLLNESYSYPASSPTLTIYQANIGQQVLIVEKFDIWRYGLGRRSQIYIVLE